MSLGSRKSSGKVLAAEKITENKDESAVGFSVLFTRLSFQYFLVFLLFYCGTITYPVSASLRSGLPTLYGQITSTQTKSE